MIEPDDLIIFMGRRGARFTEKQLEEMRNYFWRMSEDGRIAVIEDGEGLCGFVTFSICNEYEKYYKKPCWDYLPHDPSGRTAFIETLICKTWNKQVRKLFENVIVSRFPAIESGLWYRPTQGNDRKVIYRRKVCTP